MATQNIVKLEGLADLKANLEALGEEVATKIGKRANSRAARIGAAAIKARAPVSDIPQGARRTRINKGRKKGKGKTGPTQVEYAHEKIVNNVKVRQVRSRKQHVVAAVITSGRAFHASMVEKGHRNAPAHPFWGPAIDGAVGAMREAQIDELRKGIETQARKSKIRKR